ncbi:uncharacterized protein MONOS_18689 [Monocercomonoides exilis]|uniref:uncharacterized protein n=1 Tax=Monocercomonoides exilis TaxID=2049356 RepID=UPI00355945DC|nr:hypothetical protein MONOS_18689 [Monocercomonoides exilis]
MASRLKDSKNNNKTLICSSHRLKQHKTADDAFPSVFSEHQKSFNDNSKQNAPIQKKKERMLNVHDRFSSSAVFTSPLSHRERMQHIITRLENSKSPSIQRSKTLASLDRNTKEDLLINHNQKDIAFEEFPRKFVHEREPIKKECSTTCDNTSFSIETMKAFHQLEDLTISLSQEFSKLEDTKLSILKTIQSNKAKKNVEQMPKSWCNNLLITINVLLLFSVFSIAILIFELFGKDGKGIFCWNNVDFSTIFHKWKLR